MLTVLSVRCRIPKIASQVIDIAALTATGFPCWFELIQAAERCGELSDGDRVALAAKLADAALGHLRRSQRLAELARRLRAGER